MLFRTSFTICLLVILSAPELFGQRSAEITLAGYNHRPIVHTPAMGHAKVTIEGDSLYVEGEFENLRGVYWSAHIHHGQVGQTGHRMLRLKPDTGDDRHSGVFRIEENRFQLTDALREALRKGNLYINVASYRFQHGEIRGQIPPM